jgi:hypothetical protein
MDISNVLKLNFENPAVNVITTCVHNSGFICFANTLCLCFHLVFDSKQQLCFRTAHKLLAFVSVMGGVFCEAGNGSFYVLFMSCSRPPNDKFRP